jgi:hypothetical protein
MHSPYRREELIADTATLVYLLSGSNLSFVLLLSFLVDKTTLMGV